MLYLADLAARTTTFDNKLIGTGSQLKRYATGGAHPSVKTSRSPSRHLELPPAVQAARTASHTLSHLLPAHLLASGARSNTSAVPATATATTAGASKDATPSNLVLDPSAQPGAGVVGPGDAAWQLAVVEKHLVDLIQRNRKQDRKVGWC